MHVWPYQNEIISIDVTGFAGRYIEDFKRCAERFEVLLQGACFCRGSAEPQKCIASADAILNCVTFIDPDVRQAGSRPRGGVVLAEEMLRPTGLIPYDGRTDIAVSEFSPDHFIGLALFDIGDAGQAITCVLAFRRIVGNVRAVLRAPFTASLRCVARCADVPVTDLPAFDFVRTEQVGAAPALQGRREFPT